jgi:hypothetical protein
MSGDANGFNNIETRAIIKAFFLQGKAPMEIQAILEKSNRGICTIVCHPQNLGGPV